MTAWRDEPANRDRDRHERDDSSGTGGGQTPRPFDTSELDNLPAAQGDDPPYRDWWVVEGALDRGEPSSP